MKKLLLIFCIISVVLIPSFAQSKMADKKALALAQFDKVLATIESKDFVITVNPSQIFFGSGEPTYNTKFLSYENESVILQGIIWGQNVPNKLKVSDYKQVMDKNGDFKISMYVLGFYLNGKIDISLKKTEGNVARVIISSYTNKSHNRFWGRLLPRSESNYLQQPGLI